MPPSELQIVRAILDAYRDGAFPMADPETGRIDWFSPDPRALMPLALESARGAGDGFHISRSLARTLRSGRFILTADTAFERVIRACAEQRRPEDGTWIDERIVRWYTALHRRRHAHSIEAWLPAGDTSQGPLLVGGVYGVSIGAAFFAESMFSRPGLGGTDASKVCLATLVAHLRRCGYTLMDVQLRNPHTDQFGVYTVRRAKYLKLLAAAVAQPDRWKPLHPTHPSPESPFSS
jgi:leucyl/phenylalanyl-tRNA--protein transferase